MKSYDWNKISNEKKEELSKLKPIFIQGSRDISTKKIAQLAKLAEKRKLIWGVLKDEYINGLEGSIQFKTLSKKVIEETLEESKNVYLLEYYQRDLKHIFKELDFSLVILINGSWHKAIHFNPEIWQLINKKTEYKLISPFVNELEAKEYAEKIVLEYSARTIFEENKIYTDKEIFEILKEESKRSFDWNYQIASALVNDGKVLLTAHNTVIPYETYSAHFGSEREKYYVAPGDSNFYDTNHAEVELILKSNKEKIDLLGTSIYLNVLPCPTCSRMLLRSGIQEIVYSQDHSDGYAIKMFEMAGKTVRRFIP